MRKSRLIYYGSSALPEAMIDAEAIREAGVKFVMHQRRIHCGRRTQAALHPRSAGTCMGPSRDGIDCSDAWSYKTYAKDKAKSLHGEDHASACSGYICNIWWCSGSQLAFAMMNYITRCCTPSEASAATEHFDEEVLRYLCEILIHATNPN
jgi:hypothetical protein